MEIIDFLKHKQNNQALMCLDVSKNRIGVAVSSPNLSVAFPKYVIERTKLNSDTESIKSLIAQYNCWGLVVGLPLNSNGTKSTTTQSVNQFIKHLSNNIVQPIVTQDERYSTYFVKNSPAISTKNQLIDDKAACWILQNFLDILKNNYSI